MPSDIGYRVRLENTPRKTAIGPDHRIELLADEVIQGSPLLDDEGRHRSSLALMIVDGKDCTPMPPRFLGRHGQKDRSKRERRNSDKDCAEVGSLT